MHGGAHNYRVLSMNIRCIRPQQIPPRTQAKLIPSDPWVRLIRPTKTLVRCCTGNGAMSVEMARPLSPLKTADLSGEDCQQRRQKLMCLPERIILSVDVHPEMGSEYSQGHSRLTLLKRMLRVSLWSIQILMPNLSGLSMIRYELPLLSRCRHLCSVSWL